MAQVTRDQREMLRQRLLAWALMQETAPEETITDQIDHLLEEVLHEVPLVEPSPLHIDAPDDDQRVVVTGLGLVTPFGIDIGPFWSGVEAGASAIGPITLCDVRDMPCQIAGEVRNFQPQSLIDSHDIGQMSRSSQFAIVASQLALHDADLAVDEHNRDEIGVFIASSGTSYPDTEHAIRTLTRHGLESINPFAIPMALPHMASCQVAIHFGLRGYTSCISTAGASSAQAIGEAAAIIRRGDAAMMLAGGAEASISRVSVAGFCAMHLLSTRNHEPTRASRPFDAQRDGFVPGEGAGVLVLERLSHARQRGASIYAEVMGHASTCDAYHITEPQPDGTGAARALWRALINAGISPQQVDYINAHASSSSSGDIAETRAIKQIFGEYASSVPISAVKSMIGHLMGAAGAVEAAASVLALKHGVLPPTINQEEPDPECDLDYVPNEARPAILQTVVANSFATGGINTVLVFQQADSDG
jgi:3-oxoacyl-[acyl-carrier-protein] synthase II